jgi:ATP-binding cassette subfamily B protein
MVALAPVVMSGATSTFSIAITVGGALVGSEAVRKIVSSMIQMADTLIAWQRIHPLLKANSDSPTPVGNFQAIAVQEPGRDGAQSNKVIDLKDVQFQHRGRSQPVLQECRLTILSGDRVLLEGPSGSGKSSLVGIMAGLRSPDCGLLLSNGLDRQTLGVTGWRKRIAAAPQFHENHVFTETLAFNVLMGRRWPPCAEHLQEAEAVCKELGLADLLDRMPAGLMQMVGETGWQLSHGERSRVFIARALLQDADMVVLDESFAALDPASLRLCVDCVLKRSKTLLVVAHP